MIPLAAFQERTAEFISLLSDFVVLESPTADKAAVDRLGSRLQAELVQRGAQVGVEIQSSCGNHLIARWGSGPAGILLLCHMDTVHPVGSLARNPLRQVDGRLYGPGAQDMKGGILTCLAAMQMLQFHGLAPARPVTLLVTADEETGSHTSRPLIEFFAQTAALVLCMEPALSDGGLKTWRKGIAQYEITVHGRAAHAGADHEKGRNAIEELAHQILAIQAMTDYTKGTTLNVGLVSGGSASNVVPQEASATIDLRVMELAESARIEAALHNLSPRLDGTSLEVRGELNRPPMPRDARMIATFERVRAVGRSLGLSLDEGGSGGGSDANFVAPLGIAVLDGLGPIGHGEHSDHEYIEIASLPERAALLAAILANWD